MQSFSNNLVDVGFVPTRPYFVAGDSIQGNLTLSSPSGLVVGSVQAEVTCSAHSTYAHYVPGGEDSPGYFIIQPVNHHYLKTSPFVVLDARMTGGIALSSSLMQPIAFQIPVKDEMPSTLTPRTGTYQSQSGQMSVSYTLKLTTFDIAGKMVNDKAFPLEIRSLFFYPSAERPLKVYHTVVTASCCSSNAFSFYCVTDRTVYGPGDRMRLSYWYNTKSPSNMPKIVSVVVKLSLTAKSVCPTFTSLMGVDQNHALKSVVKLLENSCAVPSFGEVSHVFVDVPMNVVPNFSLDLAPHPLVYQHDLCVILGVDRRTFVLPVPVAFNSLSSAHLAQFPYPVMQKPLPRITTEAQAFYVSHPNPPSLSAAPPASGGPYIPSGVPSPGLVSANYVGYAPVSTNTN